MAMKNKEKEAEQKRAEAAQKRRAAG